MVNVGRIVPAAFAPAFHCGQTNVRYRLRRPHMMRSVDGPKWVASTRSLGSVLDIRGYDGANGGKPPISCPTVGDTPMSAKADKRAYEACACEGKVTRTVFDIKSRSRA